MKSEKKQVPAWWLAAALGLCTAGVMSVQLDTAYLRDKPHFLGKPVHMVRYGAQVEALQHHQGWTEVRDEAAGKQGWISSASLTRKKVVLKAAQSSPEIMASQDELALAGKGFSKEVEEQFRLDNAHIDYTWIDKMATWRISHFELVRFLEEGGVAP